MSKLAKRYKQHRKVNPSPEGGRVRNPPLAVDLLEWIGPGFGAFAATRFITRAASVQIAKKWPKMGKHAGAAASVGTFLGAWLLGNKVKQLEKYHTPIIVGAGIAAIQSLIQIYFPKLGWIVSDASPDVIAAGKPAPQQQQQVTQSAHDLLPDGFDDLDDSAWHSYNDARSGGRYETTNTSPRDPQANHAAEDTNEVDESLFDMLDESDEMQAQGGIFS